MDLAVLEESCERLSETLALLHEEVRDVQELARRKAAAKVANKARGYQFEVGEYVMVRGFGNAAHVRMAGKGAMLWQGPYQVLVVVGVTRLHVRIIGGGDDDAGHYVHWNQCKRFAGPDAVMPKGVVEAAQRDANQFVVEEIRDWGFDDDDAVMLLVRWEGFGPEDDTWEMTRELAKGVGRVVRGYLKAYQGENTRLKNLLVELSR